MVSRTGQQNGSLVLVCKVIVSVMMDCLNFAGEVLGVLHDGIAEDVCSNTMMLL